MIRKILLGLVLIGSVMIIFYWDTIAYGLAQAKGQIKIISETRTIDEVLADPVIPDSLKAKILIVNEVRKYAIDSIGLDQSENYTSFYDQKGETALWNLSACEPFRFEPKQWSFPFLGSFPYKGFFDVEKANFERQQLIALGYDTRIRPVGGWSTLGWFSDPILSGMLARSEGRLADLIIHELTHSTLFVKDDIVFNENLASFIGERGAIQFLEMKYGRGSRELEDYLLDDLDRTRFTHQMLYATSLLDSLYESFQPSDTDSLKNVLKNQLIQRIVDSLDSIHFYDPGYHQIFDNVLPNNAYFMSFLRYHSSEDSLNHILINEHNNDLNIFITSMKDYHQD